MCARGGGVDELRMILCNIFNMRMNLSAIIGNGDYSRFMEEQSKIKESEKI